MIHFCWIEFFSLTKFCNDLLKSTILLELSFIFLCSIEKIGITKNNTSILTSRVIPLSIICRWIMGSKKYRKKNLWINHFRIIRHLYYLYISTHSRTYSFICRIWKMSSHISRTNMGYSLKSRKYRFSTPKTSTTKIDKFTHIKKIKD